MRGFCVCLVRTCLNTRVFSPKTAKISKEFGGEEGDVYYSPIDSQSHLAEFWVPPSAKLFGPEGQKG